MWEPSPDGDLPSFAIILHPSSIIPLPQTASARYS